MIAVLTVFLFPCSQLLRAQTCPAGGITFNSQDQVDNFATNYPGCTVINGDLTIKRGGALQLTNLDGLSQITTINGSLILDQPSHLVSIAGLSNLTSIGGDLEIEYATALTSLGGLDNLTNIAGHVEIRWNSGLTNFLGLGKLTTIGEYLRVWSNENLTSMEGMSSLTRINGGLNINYHPKLTALGSFPMLTDLGGITVEDNDLLVNMDGLEAVRTCDRLDFRDNPVLEDFNALSNITTVGSIVYLLENPQLQDISGLQNVASIDGSLLIHGSPLVTSSAGLANLTSIDGTLSFARLGMTDLTGLSHLTSVNGRIQIAGLSAITSLSGLDNVDPSTIEELRIYKNPQLSTCDVASICGYLGITPSAPWYSLEDNLPNCNSIAEVLTACSNNWSTAGDGNWNEGTNWSDGLPPSSSSPAIIDGSVAVTISGEVEALSVSLLNGADLVINGNLTVPNVNDIVVSALSKLSGSGTINGDIQLSGGNFCMGNSPGLMTVNGDVQLNSGTLDVEIDGTTPGSLFDQLSASGLVTIDNSVQLNLIFGNGFEPEATDFFDIIVGNSVSGSFDENNISYSGGNVAAVTVSYPGGNTARVTVVPNTPLPVTWLDFSVKEINRDNYISWSTTSEINNRGFYVEQSLTRTQWKELAFVNGATTSQNEGGSYQWIDQSPSPGVNYYRLRQEDFDGRTQYSKVISIQNEVGHEVHVFPNPIQDEFSILNGKGSLTIYSLEGRVLFSRRISENKATISIANIPSGLYILMMVGENGLKQLKKVIKN